MTNDIKSYNDSQISADKEICEFLFKIINEGLPEAESKVWHAHPVWFLDGNPIVGYSKLKDGVRLMFWSGADFKHEGLKLGTGKFKDASITFQNKSEINSEDIQKWLKESREIQWDYKNIRKNKGLLNKLK